MGSFQSQTQSRRSSGEEDGSWYQRTRQWLLTEPEEGDEGDKAKTGTNNKGSDLDEVAEVFEYLQHPTRGLALFGTASRGERVDDMMHNKVMISSIDKDLDKALNDIEKLKDSVRANIGKLNGDH